MNPNKLSQPDIDHSFTDHIKVVIDQKTIQYQYKKPFICHFIWFALKKSFMNAI